jgi:hypothetical protein
MLMRNAEENECFLDETILLYLISCRQKAVKYFKELGCSSVGLLNSEIKLKVKMWWHAKSDTSAEP